MPPGVLLLQTLGPPCPSNRFKTNLGLKVSFWYKSMITASKCGLHNSETAIGAGFGQVLRTGGPGVFSSGHTHCRRAPGGAVVSRDSDEGVWGVQGYLAHKTAHPPRTPMGPQAWSYCRVLGGGGFL